MKTLFDDNFALPHECIDSTFMDKDHCHVIVSDLKIVNNNNLHNLLSNGPKYHENKIANYQKAKESIITEVKSSIQSYCYKHGAVFPHNYFLNGN